MNNSIKRLTSTSKTLFRFKNKAAELSFDTTLSTLATTTTVPTASYTCTPTSSNCPTGR
ncbi:hypothetical protein [Pedobacter frigoris]|uniref:hypothetical protein n=1 Tax=Pedobacter frigoris TaxID=2571272 RepID=UPI00292E9711|nr:hypothetical protein [Pedobacter frigoris]